MSIKVNSKAAQAELARRANSIKSSKTKFNIDKFLFKEQLDFVNDLARYAIAVCSVRAGKTVACAADLIYTAITKPNIVCLYVTLARSSAKKIVWPELKKINSDFSLGGKANEVDLSLKFDNGSIIYLFGAGDIAECEKIRGLSNVELAYLDECQSFRQHIKELVEQIVAKRLYDTNGRCRMIGTPGPIPAGYFYEVSQSPNWTEAEPERWSHHHWTLHKNKPLQAKSGKTADQLIAQDCARMNVNLDHPSIQRECFGVWAKDLKALLLDYSVELNHYTTLPTAKFNYILGIDLGSVDSNSLSVLGWTDASPITYLIYEKQTPGQLTSQLADDIKKLHETYHFSKMVIDTGGLGKTISEDLKHDYGLPVEAADKRDKMASYAKLNDALRTGRFKAKHDTTFASDCNKLAKDFDKSTPDKIVVKGHSDSVDSALYAFRYSPAYTYLAPPPDNRTRAEQAAETMLQHRIAQLEKANKPVEEDRLFMDEDGVPKWSKW